MRSGRNLYPTQGSLVQQRKRKGAVPFSSSEEEEIRFNYDINRSLV